MTTKGNAKQHLKADQITTTLKSCLDIITENKSLISSIEIKYGFNEETSLLIALRNLIHSNILMQNTSDQCPSSPSKKRNRIEMVSNTALDLLKALNKISQGQKNNYIDLNNFINRVTSYQNPTLFLTSLENKIRCLRDHLYPATNHTSILYFMCSFPEDLNLYRCCFIFADNQLHYINKDGVSEQIKMSHKKILALKSKYPVEEKGIDFDPIMRRVKNKDLKQFTMFQKHLINPKEKKYGEYHHSKIFSYAEKFLFAIKEAKSQTHYAINFANGYEASTHAKTTDCVKKDLRELIKRCKKIIPKHINEGRPYDAVTRDFSIRLRHIYEEGTGNPATLYSTYIGSKRHLICPFYDFIENIFPFVQNSLPSGKTPEQIASLACDTLSYYRELKKFKIKLK